MTKRRKVKVDTSLIRQRVDAFDRLRAGDIVKLTGEQGLFTFLSAAVDDAGNVRWIDLHGGTPNRERLRSVSCDRLKIPSEKALERQRRQRAQAT